MPKIKIKTAFFSSAKVKTSLKVLFLALFVLSGSNVEAVEYRLLDSAYDKEIWQLNEDINEKRSSIEELQQQTETYKKILAQKQEEIIGLKGQISLIDTSIAKLSLEIEALELQVEEVNLRLESTELKIAAKEEEMRQKKEHMAEVIRTLDHSEESNFLLILANQGKLSDYIASAQQLQTLESALMDNLESLNTLKLALVADQTSLTETQADLQKVKEELEQKSGNLSSQKYVKNALVRDTRGQEDKYQQLLEQTKAEVEAINSDIVLLEKVAREKVNRELKGDLLGADEGMMWPVPSHFVTAYFHDPDYPFRNIFEHPAVDIRASQGTPVRAAKSGFVARAKDAGLGYSYIVLVHEDGLSTVYGHVSQILVDEDNFVTKGQIIAYSGGQPGTPGAGRLTTAAHLHFEVRIDGIPVNPLNYLP